MTEMRMDTQLRRVAAVLSWDQETYMPTRSARARADQISLILTISHARFTGVQFRRSLGTMVDLDSGAVQADGLLPEETRLLEITWRDWHRATALPVEFVGEMARLASEAQHVWEQARRESSFDQLAPYLEKIFNLKRREADYLGYQEAPYDALLEGFEPGMTGARLAEIFQTLQPALVDLLGRIRNVEVADNREFLFREYDETVQWEFGMAVLGDMGFDFSRGRQDLSAHPFTTDFHPSDVRITTRISPRAIMMGILSTIHEGGHALYEQALQERHFGTPLCEAISIGIHESQSRLWEIYVGLSRPFWEHYYPLLQEKFPQQLDAVSLDQFYAAINTVTPTPVRLDADEVSYNLHILLRVELEQALINDNLPVRELPTLWNEGMQKYIGIIPANDAEGVLQDIHWSVGSIGYFPTYTLGTLYGRQFYDVARSQIDDFDSGIARGELLHLREWLRENIHQVGRSKTAEEITRELTGEPLSAKPFVDYLEQKYGSLYGV